jgi:hypothetical protein
MILKGLSEQVDKAFDDDNPEANKLARQLDKARGEYQTRKESRNTVIQSMSQKIYEQQAEDFNESIKVFQTEIVKHVKDWSDDVALKNRNFALGLGLNEQFVDTITDPIVVKVIDEYRRLKEASKKGVVKRKKAAVKRVPTKKASSAKTKKSNRVDEARQRVKKGKNTEKDDGVIFDSVIDDLFS